MYFGVVFAFFFWLGVSCDSWMCGFIVSPNVQNFQHYFSKKFTSTLFLLFFRYSSYTYTSLLEVAPQRTDVLFNYLSDSFFSCFGQFISLCLQGHLITSFGMSNLWLISLGAIFSFFFLPSVTVVV